MATRFLRGVAMNVTGQVVPAAASLLLTPIVYRGLGDERYALFALMSVITSFATPLTLGAGPATARWISRTRGDLARSWEWVRLSWLLHVAGPSFAALILLVVGPLLLLQVFAVPPALEADAHWIVLGAAVGSVAYNVVWSSVQALFGLQRTGTANTLLACLATGTLLGSAMLVAAGHGLRALGCWYAAMHLVLALAAIAFVAHVLGGIRPGTRLPPRDETRAFLRFSALTCVSNVLWLVNYQADKLLVAFFLPLESLAHYHVPFALTQRLYMVPAAIAFAGFIKASDLDASRDRDALQRIALKTTKLVLLAVLPAVVLLFAFAPEFLTLWLGSEFAAQAAWPLRLMAVATLAASLSMVPAQLAQGLGHPEFHVYWMAATGVVNLVLWLLLIPPLGIVGAALGSLLAQATVPLLVGHVNRACLGLSWDRWLRGAVVGPAVSALIVLVPCLLLHDRATTWLRLVVGVGLGLLAFSIATWTMLDSEERSNALRFVGLR